jgi:hypothetical protein
MNNIHSDSPPIMADGRNYANWQPGAVINENIRARENIKTNWDYRTYLQQNAKSIMDFDRRMACEQTNCTNTNNTIAPVQSDLKQLYLSRQQLQKNQILF